MWRSVTHTNHPICDVMSHLQTTSVTLRHTWGTLSVTLCHSIRLLNYNTKIYKTIFHGFALVAKIFCLAPIAVTPGKQPYFASFRATLAGLVPLTALRKLHLFTSWDCARLWPWRESGTCTLRPRRNSSLRCARNYHLTNQLPLIVHLISWLTSTIHSWTNVHPCKVSVSQGLKLTVLRFTKPTYPIIYTCPISLPLNLLSADSWCWCGISARGRQWCK